MSQKTNKAHFILEFLNQNPNKWFSSGELFSLLPQVGSQATLKRLLSEMIQLDRIAVKGKGKSTRYSLSGAYPLTADIDPAEYFKQEIDERVIKKTFQFDLIREVLPVIQLFSPAELDELNQLQSTFREKIKQLNPSEFATDMERLAIDLSWKSSQIEGNTYTLLETERLIRESITASGKTKHEANMLLNHKEAIDFLVAHPDYVRRISPSKIEAIHQILIKDLEIDGSFRKRKVGITGTNYTPLENEFQILDALDDMCYLVNKKENVFEKALLTLVLISYIQPFNDGNKRTARIMSNAILLDHKHCPLSFRTVDSLDYKTAMLIFYEQNNFSAIKKIFLEQYRFAVHTYF